jgi:hypothetical protein
VSGEAGAVAALALLAACGGETSQPTPTPTPTPNGTFAYDGITHVS